MARPTLTNQSYWIKAEAELRYIIKDAGEAARAMRGHDAKAEGKYLDQVNDACSVLAYRLEQFQHRHSYCPAAVDKAIASSNRSGRRISRREARMIHALLGG